MGVSAWVCQCCSPPLRAHKTHGYVSGTHLQLFVSGGLKASAEKANPTHFELVSRAARNPSKSKKVKFVVLRCLPSRVEATACQDAFERHDEQTKFTKHIRNRGRHVQEIFLMETEERVINATLLGSCQTTR